MAGKPEKAMFIADCPRCGHNKTTFDILAESYSREYDYRVEYECYMRCRSCAKPSNALLRAKNQQVSPPTSNSGIYVNVIFSLKHWVFEIPNSRRVPEHVEPAVARIFQEGANCLAIGAFDASGAMFRKVLDAATREKTPTPEADVSVKPANWKTYKDLRLRLDWLFEHGVLDRSLEDLSSCIHQDGNDAAHDLVGIGMEEAEDLADFAEQVLRIIYTTPGQIAANKRRRDERRGTPHQP
ncbi:DUF4145 domain-containing protein [Erythrobacter mangrovi]|uniref:DUF4145 domain-containing protein n=1 Tax=Erythrobacter mangrovi TaxID=2739433 RepID=A0A7D4BA71_9SPHN|nr:DUF4145 domain-containing protein [Erythrobacter mangrovi]QKG70666.1 DUF4145 domain-containing protein [Erythrobacter mangrovi]